jgi:hypothetical protein
MSTIFQTSISEDRLSLAKTRDARVRELERQFKSGWLELADLCIAVEEFEDWKVLGFSSWNKWLMDACPTSRSMAYLAMGIRKELRDIPDEDLKQIPIGNADMLKISSKAARSDRKLLEAAKTLPPREFVSQAILASPDHAIEHFLPRKFKFTTTQGKNVQAAIDMMRIMSEEDISDEEAIEYIAANWMLANQAEYESRKVEAK